jgi:hypothetical protein
MTIGPRRVERALRRNLKREYKMARKKLTDDEKLRVQNDRKHGIKKSLAVMWTRTDHEKHLLKQREFERRAQRSLERATA